MFVCKLVQYTQKLFYKSESTNNLKRTEVPFAWGGNHSNSSLLERFPLGSVWDGMTTRFIFIFELHITKTSQEL